MPKVFLDLDANQVVITARASDAQAVMNSAGTVAAAPAPMRQVFQELTKELENLDLNVADERKLHCLANKTHAQLAKSIAGAEPCAPSQLVPDENKQPEMCAASKFLRSATSLEVRRSVGSLSGKLHVYPILHGRLRVRVWLTSVVAEEVTAFF